MIRVYTAMSKKFGILQGRYKDYYLKSARNAVSFLKFIRSIFVDNSFFRSIIIIGYFRTKEDFHG